MSVVTLTVYRKGALWVRIPQPRALLPPGRDLAGNLCANRCSLPECLQVARLVAQERSMFPFLPMAEARGILETNAMSESEQQWTAADKPGKGGDMIFTPSLTPPSDIQDWTFTPGKGGHNPVTGETGPDGSIIFLLADGTEFLRLSSDGSAYVRGEKVASNAEVYVQFRCWLQTATGRMEEP